LDHTTSQKSAGEIAKAPASLRPGEKAGRNKLLFTSALLAVSTFLILLARIEQPPFLFFDESSYVAIARGLLNHNLPPLQSDSPVGRHHPLLGSYLIAAGMKIAGDNPLGWRLASVVAGAATLVAIFLWTYVLIQDYWLALFAAGLTFFNNFFYVMARVAMLDIFVFAFSMWGLLAFTAAVYSDLAVRTRRILSAISGLAFGLAGACKWNAVDTFAVALVSGLLLFRLAQAPAAGWNKQLAKPAQNARRIGLPTLAFGLIVVPAATYLCVFSLIFHATHTEFLLHAVVRLHVLMFELTKGYVGNRAIASAWYSWPFRASPLRGLSYLMGNWVVMWGGLAALGVALRRLYKSPALPEALLLAAYLANLLQWAVTPMKVQIYYYYFSSAMMLAPAIAVSLRRDAPPRILGIRVSLLVMLAAMAFFLYCYPRMAHLEAPWDCMFGCWD